MIIKNLNIMKNKEIRNIIKFEIIDIIKSNWFFIYSGIIFLFMFMISYFSSGNSSEIIATITNFFLLILPIFTMLFGIVNFNESLHFQTLLMIRNISRNQILSGKFLGILISLTLSFMIGILPSIFFIKKLYDIFYLIILLSFYSIIMHAVFLSFSFFISQFHLRLEIKISIAILIWFILYILYDSLIFLIVIGFGDYPIEPLLLFLILLNPIDLVRTILLIHGELSAIMNYTSALYFNELGSIWGIILGVLVLSGWSFILYYLTQKKFIKKDL